MKDFDLKGLGGINFNKPNIGKTSGVNKQENYDFKASFKRYYQGSTTSTEAFPGHSRAVQTAWETVVLPNYASVGKAPINKHQENLTVKDSDYIPDRPYADEEV
ncbi:hypothetical protein J6G99_09010 [bacterium]|nr:hypothetical protein [bacterium]